MPFPGIAYPDDLSVMQEVIEGYCLASNIADEDLWPGRSRAVGNDDF